MTTFNRLTLPYLLPSQRGLANDWHVENDSLWSAYRPLIGRPPSMNTWPLIRWPCLQYWSMIGAMFAQLLTIQKRMAGCHLLTDDVGRLRSQTTVHREFSASAELAVVVGRRSCGCNARCGIQNGRLPTLHCSCPPFCGRPWTSAICIWLRNRILVDGWTNHPPEKMSNFTSSFSHNSRIFHAKRFITCVECSETNIHQSSVFTKMHLATEWSKINK